MKTDSYAHQSSASSVRGNPSCGLSIDVNAVVGKTAGMYFRGAPLIEFPVRHERF
jgi:hypothetical protein